MRAIMMHLLVGVHRQRLAAKQPATQRPGSPGRALAVRRDLAGGEQVRSAHGMMRQLPLTVLLLSAMVLAACGGAASGAAKSPGGGSMSGNSQVMTLKSTDQMRFEPATLTVRANAPVTLTLDNSGAALIHDFVIDNAGGGSVKIEAQPHSRASGEFTLPAGTYQFYCAQPGHREAGMVGTLIVS
jgi:uncharacterized cupredoxin-like copper-binding protein